MLALIPKWLINVSLGLQVNVIIIWSNFILQLYFVPTIELEDKGI